MSRLIVRRRVSEEALSFSPGDRQRGRCGPSLATSERTLVAVPRISEFYGIVVAMYFNDHAPPHFHVAESGSEASLRIDTLEVFEGSLPARALRLVRTWARLHKLELSRN